MAAQSAREIVEAIRELDDDAKAAIGKELAPHIPVTLGRRQMLGVGAAALLGAGGASGAGAAAQQAVEPAQAADGVVNDIDVLKSGDGSPMTAENAIVHANESVSSATTIGNVMFVYYDSSVGGFTISIPSSLEQKGIVLRFIDETGNAGTNAVTVEASDGTTVATIDASDTVFETFHDGGEWLTDRFIPTVDAGAVNIDGNTALRNTAESAATPGFGSWTQVSATRPAIVIADTLAETDGTSVGDVRLEVDQSGGTTTDYSVKNKLDADHNAGASQQVGITAWLAPGAQYQIRNVVDPNNANQINEVREITL